MLDNPLLQTVVCLDQPVYPCQKLLIGDPHILEASDKCHVSLTKAVAQHQALLVEIRIALLGPGGLLFCQLEPVSQRMAATASSPVLPATAGAASTTATRPTGAAILGATAPPVSSLGGAPKRMSADLHQTTLL